MRDPGGRVVEGTMSNLFVVTDGRLMTPSLANCGVAGIVRSEVIERAAAMDLVCVEEELTLEDIEQADELFLTNSLIGVWPIREFDGRTYPVGPICRNISACIREEKAA